MSEIKIIGIDEAGRGALAGPVVVAAAAIPYGARFRKTGLKLRDSKKLTAKERKEWFEYFKNHPQVRWAVAETCPKVIDKINISNAANNAASRAILKILEKERKTTFKVFLDGGLYLSKRIIKQNNFNICCCETVVRGDERITAVKIASIVAKVYRDELMIRLARKYPHYGFSAHKGYGTKEHFKAIKRCGLSCVHRKNFIHEQRLRSFQS